MPVKLHIHVHVRIRIYSTEIQDQFLRRFYSNAINLQND